MSNQILTRDPGSHQAIKFIFGSQDFTRESGSYEASRVIPKRKKKKIEILTREPGSQFGARFLQGSMKSSLICCCC